MNGGSVIDPEIGRTGAGDQQPGRDLYSDNCVNVNKGANITVEDLNTEAAGTVFYQLSSRGGRLCLTSISL